MDLYAVLAGEEDFDRWDYVDDYVELEDAEDEPDPDERSLEEYLETVEL